MSKELRPRWLTAVVVIIVTVHIGILTWISSVNSPNIDELAHLPSGISHWEYGRFDLYRVNPPLVRMVAAVPVMLAGAERDWSNWKDSPYSRSEFWVGKDFVKNNGFNTFWYFSLARFACIPFSVLGCIVSYRWASELYGWRSGLVALLMYAFCPNFIAWGASMTPDAASASTGVLAAWIFWKWLENSTWRRAALAGATLGLALLTKSTWIFFLILYPVLWTVILMFRPQPDKPQPLASGRQLVTILLLGVYILNLGYGFEGSFTPLGKFAFISKSLSGKDMPQNGANRFAGTIAGNLPVPLPANYVRGIDVQKCDFERGKWSYLRGEQKKGGWWYYYLYGLLVKTPIGFLGLIFYAFFQAIVSFRKVKNTSLLNELILLLPAVFILLLISSQTGFNRYVRYALPAMPFIYIFTSRIICRFKNGVLSASLVSGLLLLGIIEASLILPHSMSFFNIAAGGPVGGPRHLVDSNVDWGQDLLFLKKWYDDNPDARPLHVAYFPEWDIAPSTAGIECSRVPKQDLSSNWDIQNMPPGWYAVSVNYLYGYHYFGNDEPVYEYFRSMKPVARAGYSIYIYRINK